MVLKQIKQNALDNYADGLTVGIDHMDKGADGLTVSTVNFIARRLPQEMPCVNYADC
jgi:hypothetical protein